MKREEGGPRDVNGPSRDENGRIDVRQNTGQIDVATRVVEAKRAK